MVQRSCGSCGAPLRSPDQKFCASCGAPVPEQAAGATPAPSGSPSGRVPLWLFAAAIAAVAFMAVFVLVPLLAGTVPAAASSGPASGAAGLSPSASAGGTPATGASPLPTAAVYRDTQTIAPAGTTAATTAAATIATTATVPVTTTVPPTSSPATTSPTPVPTEVVVTLPTSQITLAVTKVPTQPPASSYSSSTPGAPYITPGSLEARIHVLINAQREQNGHMPLSYDSFLSDIARGHSWDMVTRQFFDHVNPDGKNPKARGDDAGYPCIRTYKSYSTIGIAENLFQTNRYSAYYTAPNGSVVSYDWNTEEQLAQTVVNGWMNSDGHRKNILSDSYYQEGIGVAFASDDKILVTENFC